MALLAAAGGSQQKPVKEVPLVINYAVKPITLERATARAHAVVRARVVGSQFRDLREPGAPVANVNTAYAFLYWNENLATYQMFFGVTARIASPLRTGSTRSVVACWHSVTRGRTLVRSLIVFARSLPSCVLRLLAHVSSS
jgi:hypothetical protein